MCLSIKTTRPDMVYSVVSTSDAFPDPEDAFAIWAEDSDGKGNYFASPDGRVLAFPTQEKAKVYRTY